MIGSDAPVFTTGLTKRFRRQVVVDRIDLEVPTGAVYGFLGPNGSGKTTTIRMLLGLIAATAGEIRVLGRPIPAAAGAVLPRVGALVEGPAFHPYLSGRANLGRLDAADRASDPRTSRARVDAALDRVGLLAAAEKRYRAYSLGMRQRLAIAATLLKDPALLIFDEPTNGLDPAGIHEIRATMRDLGDRGKTVLVSSHILSEVQQVADTVTIIGRGRLLAEGTVAEILDAAGGQYAQVGISDPARAAAILSAAGFLVSAAGRGLHVGSANGRLDLSSITRVLADQGLYVEELVPVRRDLESVFLELTADEHLGATQPRRSRRARLQDGQ